MDYGNAQVKEFEVALSFAGEEREYVEQVAEHLQEQGVAVFYDRFEPVYLWERDLTEEFNLVFERSNAIAVMFISANYVKKAWPTHERKSILSKMVSDNQALVLPVRFDSTAVPGLPDSLAYVDANNYSAAELAAMVMDKLGVAPLSGKTGIIATLATSTVAGGNIAGRGGLLLLQRLQRAIRNRLRHPGVRNCLE